MLHNYIICSEPCVIYTVQINRIKNRVICFTRSPHELDSTSTLWLAAAMADLNTIAVTARKTTELKKFF